MSVARQTRYKSVSDLEQAGLLPGACSHDYADLGARYAIGVNSQVVGTIADPVCPLQDPVGRQYLPSPEELQRAPEELRDPTGDEAHSPVTGIVHRYPDRVLLKISNICAVYCRYCFRREMVGPGQETLTDADLEKALAYIEATPAIWEVILTGGDPLVLSARRLESILDRLNRIAHVQVVRIHSRVPVADPQRITKTLCSVLKTSAKPLYVVIHINHPQEITESVVEALRELRASGCSLLSQSVLLKGVNDDARVLDSLFRALIGLHVKPYYLHHPDLAPGTGHFRVDIETGRAIMRALQGRLSGICLPRYVLDIPGGFGKVPIEHCYAAVQEDGDYLVEDIDGRVHAYPPRVRAGDG
ncbi:MAG: lysine-2,3-aminomutase-like protein [Alphaproteobacteria bacterium]|nr:lysine-2,3-aminomutase-like protein [Alphaproteobacteria bacterium]MCB9975296.1 lysine-2,3-aminomutase-like protein [Rhodospirillales bacterium]